MSRNIPTRKVLTLTEKTLSPILFSLTAVLAVYSFDMRKFKVEYLGMKDQGFILIKPFYFLSARGFEKGCSSVH